MSKKTYIIGGGTFSHVRNHLSLAAPAWGTTARKLHGLMGGTLVLTKMAEPFSDIVTNKDLKSAVDAMIEDPSVSTIIFNAAVCDFEAQAENIESGKHAERLRTENGNINLTLTPSEKIIKTIREKRPDIFLVGFKTTTNRSPDEQFLMALKMMKSTKCNLVLANDVVTRYNFIVTPEEAAYCKTHDRDRVLQELANFVHMRTGLTYERTIFTQAVSVSVDETSSTFKTVLRHIINNGGYIENNGNGFTPGHFCQRMGDKQFLSSQRKADHNNVFQEGMTLVTVENDKFYASGARKPSVGARSQWLMLNQHKDYDCIIHTHNPRNPNGVIPVVQQKPFQCGSHECGINTVTNLHDFDGIKAVFLEKHGVNILFKSTDDPARIINFINENIILGKKIGLD